MYVSANIESTVRQGEMQQNYAQHVKQQEIDSKDMIGTFLSTYTPEFAQAAHQFIYKHFIQMAAMYLDLLNYSKTTKCIVGYFLFFIPAFMYLTVTVALTAWDVFDPYPRNHNQACPDKHSLNQQQR